MRSTQGLYAVVLGAACFAIFPAANAQDRSPPATPEASPPAATEPTTPAPPAAVTEQKLDATAAAVKKVTAVKENYQQKFDQASEAEKPRVADEANAAMAQAVTDQGISIQEYTSILQVAQNNPAVKEKLLQRLK